MTTEVPASFLQLRSRITSGGELELSLVEVAHREPGPDEVLIRVEAAPINPSDLGLLLGSADLSTAKLSGTARQPVLTARVPQNALAALAARLDDSMPVGNEGAGVVVKAGSAPAAQALLGKIVAGFGGAMYAQYRCLYAADCLPLPAGATAADGASSFVNPITALVMVETMRKEGHTALVHTAAASNLGQMLNRICLKDGIDLVNIVRRPAQAKILAAIGARHVVDSSSENFRAELVDALVATGATLAFDAIGGGALAGQILDGMEIAANRNASGYSRYGSATHKQVYIYGGLDTSPTLLNRAFGMSWGIGGFLLPLVMMKAGPVVVQRLRDRVAAELTTTFASHYAAEISLAEAVQPEMIAAYAKVGTGEKYLINPAK